MNQLLERETIDAIGLYNRDEELSDLDYINYIEDSLQDEEERLASEDEFFIEY